MGQNMAAGQLRETQLRKTMTFGEGGTAIALAALALLSIVIAANTNWK